MRGNTVHKSTGPAGNAGLNSRWSVVRRWASALLVAALPLTGIAVAAGPAAAAEAGSRVNLRVLVVSNGTPSVEALATQMDREGVPYTKVLLGSDARPVVDEAFLADTATGTARFQAVVLPNHSGGGLTDAEVDALTDYERTYGIRRVSAYNWPSAAIGLEPPVHAGSLDGGSVTVSDAGRAGPFAYLRGLLPVDDFDPAVTEVYGYLSQPVTPRPAGESFTPLLSATVDGTTGVLAGVDARDGREELVLTAAVNPSMQWFNQVGHGIVTWMTRGIHLGHQRNYFAVHVDDVLLADSRWSVDGNCTPGDDCVDPNVSTPDIRMTAADADRLVAWQRTNDFALDMVFNGGGSDAHVAETGQPDPLAAALVANQTAFPWINHTYSHPFMGCIQVAPTVVGQPWHCATDPAEGPRQDPEILGTMQAGTYWASQDYLAAQISWNIQWARASGLTDFDPTELVTGEHSGLTVQPQQPTDNPFLGAALASTGVRYTASDASREPDARAAGTGTVTVPRHPMNIYYNAGTFRDEVDEYNWYYTSRANGGGGICEDNPAVSTCVAPLPAATAAQARESFARYIQPMETRNALRFVLTNDPRPFYAHQSNLAEDGILYPVLESVLSGYRAVYAANAPVVRTDMRTQSQILARQAAWANESDAAVAYLDATGVHLPDIAADVPLTVPAGTSVAGVALSSYGGELSGWASRQVTAVPPGGTGGYLPVAPDAPAIGGATAGDGSATVTWSAPVSDGGSPLTGYVVSVFTGEGSAPVRTVGVPATATTAVIQGLVDAARHSFTVAAVNAQGAGSQSERSNVVIPGLPGAPTIGTAKPGDRSATVTWSPPASKGAAPITSYAVAVYLSTETTPVRTVKAAAGATSVPVTGLINGTPYSFTVSAMSGLGTGPASARSNGVVPGWAPDAPSLRQVEAGNASVAVTWTAPRNTGSGLVTGYLVSVSRVSGNAPASTLAVAGNATSATVTGLTNGTSYTVTVAATNAVGTGAASAPSRRFTPLTVPGTPAGVTATAGSRSAAVSWSAPTIDGGSPVLGYLVVGYRGESSTPYRLVTAGRSATGVTMTGLSADASYRFVVVAVSAAGPGDPSPRTAPVTPRK
jgi:hypothetical protein